MPIINRIVDFKEDMTAWRRHLHAHPELDLQCQETADFVVNKLREFGADEIHEGIATSGVVAILNGNSDGPTIGLRADMDALPMQEATGKKYKSTINGRMHACGHDGHTAMLLGAARYLAETQNFSGKVALIFQPAEETVGGGRIMCEEGIMDRFRISQVYALHSLPGIPAGDLQTCKGPILASENSFHIRITGTGGHAAMANETVDPIMVVSHLAQSLQTIVTRNLDPIDRAVLSITQIHAGTADNIVPDTAEISGTLRTFSHAVLNLMSERMKDLANKTAAGFGARAEVKISDGYPPTINSADETDFAAKVAAEIVGENRTDSGMRPTLGAEDFSYMLEQRPGNYTYIGNGDSAQVHHPEYDFNDEALTTGASYFARLVETAQPKLQD